MKEKKENRDVKEDKINIDENVMNTIDAADEECSCKAGCADEKTVKELENLRSDLDEKNRKIDEYLDKLQRLAAEFDNFKKRTAKEKEALYSDAVCDVTSVILPVVDNLDRALQACSNGDDFQALKEGVELVFRQLMNVFKKIGVEEIDCANACFDPQIHNAVMHVEDDECGQNIVVEEFQKGYVYRDKVIRHSMVKVAN